MAKSRVFIARTVPFRTFLKLSFLFGLALGILCGITCIAGAVLGAGVHAHIGPYRFEGIEAGLLGLALCPLLGGLTFFLLAPLMHIPFKMVNWLFGGLILPGDT